MFPTSQTCLSGHQSVGLHNDLIMISAVRCGHVTYIVGRAGSDMENLAATLLLFVVLCCQQSVQAQDNVCTKATSDPSHCICDTPNGRIDVTSIGNADKTPK